MNETVLPSGILKSLDQLLDSPHLNVLLLGSHTIEVLRMNPFPDAFHTVMVTNDEILLLSGFWSIPMKTTTAVFSSSSA